MKSILFCAALLVVALTIMQGQQTHTPALPPDDVAFSSLSAEDLVQACKDASANPVSASGTMCLTYVAGFKDGFGIAMAKFNHQKQSGFCPPPEVTTSQAAKVIVKFAADHPNLLWSGAALFTAIALKDAYPCKE